MLAPNSRTNTCVIPPTSTPLRITHTFSPLCYVNTIAFYCSYVVLGVTSKYTFCFGLNIVLYTHSTFFHTRYRIDADTDPSVRASWQLCGLEGRIRERTVLAGCCTRRCFEEMQFLYLCRNHGRRECTRCGNLVTAWHYCTCGLRFGPFHRIYGRQLFYTDEEDIIQ